MPSFDTLTDFAECLVTQEALLASIDHTANAINEFYGDEPVVMWPVLNSALVFAGLLIPKLKLNLCVSAIRVSRYEGNRAGTQLIWKLKSDEVLEGRHLLICDDIFDEGITLQAIYAHAQALKPQSVRSVVMAFKEQPRRNTYIKPDWQSVHLPNRFVFGAGMDYHERWRNAPGIWAERLS